MSVTGLVVDAAPDMAAPKRKSEQCGTCRFWQADPTDQCAGNCRRSPPRIIGRALPSMAVSFIHISDVFTATRFPRTQSEGWCGEFAWRPDLEPFTGIC